MMRLKVLISAYACLPGRGSEPGIGWNTVQQLRHHHEVWVITRTDNRPAIEAELARAPQPNLHFIYYDPLGWARHPQGNQFHYWFWQLGLYAVARKLHRREHFDLTHHVSYVRWWAPSLLALLPVPFVWGPVGGGEAVAPPFRAGLSAQALKEERRRDLLIQASMKNPLVRLTARRSALVLANTTETAVRVRTLGAKRIHILGESGVDEAALIPEVLPRPKDAPIQFASLTRLIYWKGVHLGLEAFARLQDERARYCIVGEGPERERLQAQARRLGIADRVTFHSHLSRPAWLRLLHECDALVHPCLANSGSMISLEAMAAGRPVIGLDIGGLRSQVTPETGFLIPAATPADAVEGLARAMRTVVHDRDRTTAMGRRARERVCQQFTWEHRASLLHAAYQEALSYSNMQGGAPEAMVAPPLESSFVPAQPESYTARHAPHNLA